MSSRTTLGNERSAQRYALRAWIQLLIVSTVCGIVIAVTQHIVVAILVSMVMSFALLSIVLTTADDMVAERMERVLEIRGLR